MVYVIMWLYIICSTVYSYTSHLCNIIISFILLHTKYAYINCILLLYFWNSLHFWIMQIMQILLYFTTVFINLLNFTEFSLILTTAFSNLVFNHWSTVYCIYIIIDEGGGINGEFRPIFNCWVVIHFNSNCSWLSHDLYSRYPVVSVTRKCG